MTDPSPRLNIPQRLESGDAFAVSLLTNTEIQGESAFGSRAGFLGQESLTITASVDMLIGNKSSQLIVYVQESDDGDPENFSTIAEFDFTGRDLLGGGGFNRAVVTEQLDYLRAYCYASDGSRWFVRNLTVVASLEDDSGISEITSDDNSISVDDSDAPIIDLSVNFPTMFSLLTTQERVDSGTVQAGDSNNDFPVSWHHKDGATLLTYSDPLHPVFPSGGTYGLNVMVGDVGTPTVTSRWTSSLVLNIGTASVQVLSSTLCESWVVGLEGRNGIACHSYTGFIPVNSTLTCLIHWDGAGGREFAIGYNVVPYALIYKFH